jgi:hypothetical protein
MLIQPYSVTSSISNGVLMQLHPLNPQLQYCSDALFKGIFAALSKGVAERYSDERPADFSTKVKP